MEAKRDLILIRIQKIRFKDIFLNDVKPIFSFKGLMRSGDRFWRINHVEEYSRQSNVCTASQTRESMELSGNATSLGGIKRMR